MFNNRIVIAQKELFISIFNQFGKNYNDYKLVVNKYNSVFRPLAAWMLARDSDEFAINDIVSHLTEYINRKKLNSANIKVSKNFVVINDNSFSDLTELIDFVHGNFPVVKKQEETTQQQETDHIPVLTGDGIKVFKVEKALDSKRLAADTPWCIAYAGPNNMWQSYRSNQAATFFIVWDENPPTPNQRKVALQYNKNNVQITDIPNRTGQFLSNDISFEYEGNTIKGRDIPTYLTYLKSKGVDIDATTINTETGEEEKVLKNKPLSEDEILATNLGRLATENKSSIPSFNVEDIKTWAAGKFAIKAPVKMGFIKEENPGIFKIYEKGRSVSKDIPISEDKIVEKTQVAEGDSLSHLYSSITLQSDNFKTYLSKFIGMGWILPNDIFDYLFEIPGGDDYLVQYVNTGLELPREQIDKIQTKKQLFNSYVKQQLTAWEFGHNNGAIIKYLDPNDAKDREKVLKSFDKAKNPASLPKNWKENIPQIGLSVAGLGEDLIFNDPLADKLAIAKGLFHIYQRNPTLENTRIYLHTPEAIEPLKAQAEANGYNSTILKSPSKYDYFAQRWQFIPEEFKNLPEFYEISKIIEVSHKQRYKTIEKLRNKEESELTQDDLETGIAFSFWYPAGSYFLPFEKSAKFWNYFYDNYEKYISGRFNRIGIETRDIPDDVDQDDEDFDETEYPIIEDSFERKNFIDFTLRQIPRNLLLDSDLREKFLKRFSNKDLIVKLLDFPSSEKYNDLAAEYINSIQDLPPSIAFYLAIEKNSITEKILKISTLQDFNNFMKRNRSQLDIRDYARFLYWYPFISDQITDQILLQEWTRLQYATPTEKLQVFNNLMNARPDFFRNHWQELNLPSAWLEELKQKNIIRPTQVLEPTIEEKEDEEEPTTASVKLMVKIAQKLDLKKKYRLADKLTYILRKKI